MSILSRIGSWVATNLPVVTKFVKKAAEVVHRAASVVDALLEGRSVIEDDPIDDSSRKQKTRTERPNIINGGTGHHKDDLSEIQERLDESKRKISTIQESNDLEHRRIQLQIDVMELVVSASTFERFTNNINLHAANLQIHLQTIQNTAGLLDGVNRQRVAIKALMGTVNHLINVLGVNDKVDKLEGLDIDVRPGSVSIYKAYEAFENTKELLLEEIDSFSEAISDQMERVENVRKAARLIPSSSKKVGLWLSDSVEPKLSDARKIAEELKGDLLVIPKLEANLRRELQNSKPSDA